MGAFQSFAELLEKKIRQEILSERQNSKESLGTREFEEPWTHLVAEMSPRTFSQAQKAQAYHRLRRPRPPHQLSADQQKAFDFIRGYQALSPSFGARELQQVFRQLALRLHPDQGGSAAGLQKLLWARQELQKLLA